MGSTNVRTERSHVNPRRATGPGWLALGLALLALGPALTIPLTMPEEMLQRLRIGAAEFSFWLLAITALAALLAGAALRRAPRDGAAWVPRIALVAALIGVAFSAIPGSQLPDTIDAAEAAMQAGLERSYALRIPGAFESRFRPTPFDLGEYVGGVNTGTAPVTRDLPFRTVEGQTLLLDRYDPPAPGPHPGLLIVHGGGWEGGDKNQYTEANHYFATRGYLVYDIQYRLAPGARFPAQLEDVECALGYMRAHAAEAGLDPERVIVMGRSAGAHLALLTAYRAARDPAPPGCTPPATVRGVVAYYGPTDLREGYLHPAEPDIVQAHRLMTQFLGGSPDQVPDLYRAATPQTWLDRPVPPTLLVHGEADQLVPVRQSRLLAAALQRTGNRVVLITLPWAGHAFDYIFRGPASQTALYYWERFMAYVLTTSDQ